VHRALLLALLVAACKRHAAAPPPAKTSHDAVPHTTMPIAIDGEWDEHDWPQRAFRAQFVGSDGGLSRPSSEVRMLHDDSDLIVALYAADENIETRDAFDFAIGPVALHVDATGKVTPPLAGVRARTGFDEGTLDNPKDDDEEWVVELAIPLAATGLTKGVHQDVKASRCDIPKDGIQRCGSWHGSVTLE
jgi:hypothetical protein